MQPSVNIDQLFAKIGNLTIENDFWKQKASELIGQIASLEGQITALNTAKPIAAE